jgi:hypothetical protein
MESVTVRLEEEERQAVLLALAKLSIERPGWDDMLNLIALKMDNQGRDARAELYDSFRSLNGSGEQEEARILAAAAAIANARGMRRGIPPIVNVLDALPSTLIDEVTEDARAALNAKPEPA